VWRQKQALLGLKTGQKGSNLDVFAA